MYEMAESSPRNMDINDALAMVETGICNVYGDSTNNTFSEGSTKNSPVFTG